MSRSLQDTGRVSTNVGSKKGEPLESPKQPITNANEINMCDEAAEAGSVSAVPPKSTRNIGIIIPSASLGNAIKVISNTPTQTGACSQDIKTPHG